MNKISFVLFRIILPLFFANTVFAQQNIVGDTLIFDSKSGKVAKYIKKNGLNCNCLKIYGEINNEDLLALTLNAGVLKYLDFSEAIIKVTDRRDTYGDFYIISDLDFRAGKELTIKIPSKGIYKKNVLPIQYELRAGSETKLRVLAPQNCYIKSISAGISALKYSEDQVASHIPDVDILEVENESLYNTYKRKDSGSQYKCCMIVNTTNGDVLINWWKPNFGIEYIEDAIFISPYSIRDCEYRSITFKRLKELGEGALFTLDNLVTARFPVLEKITGSFCGTKIEKVVLPSTLKSFQKDAFRCSDSKIKSIEFTSTQPPTCAGYDKYTFWYGNILVPKGSLHAYMRAFGDVESNARIHESGSDTKYTVHSDTPGYLEQQLTTEICQNAEYLIITGQVYDTDKKIVEQKAKWAKNVDWSKATVVKSPATLSSEKEAAERHAQWEKDRPKREAEEKKLAERRRKYGVGNVSEGYNIGYKDGYRSVNCYWGYVASSNPLYTEGFLDGYLKGFSRGSDDKMKDDLEHMKHW